MTQDEPTPSELANESELTYEQARDELVAVVARLENGGVGLEESITLWERGEELAAICQRWLDGARDRLEKASRGEDSDDQDSEPT